MRPHNSVGGYRIYPTSPADAEEADTQIALVALFNEGMDRLRRERELNQREQRLLANLPPNSQLVRDYQGMSSASNLIWRLGLEHQESLNNGVPPGPFTLRELGEGLIRHANRWQQWKQRLNEQA